jgi:hypothetical protein
MAESNNFVAEIDYGLSSKERLLACIANKLKFPDFYAQNWDSTLDALRDLSWINEKVVHIQHHDTPNIGSEQLAIYMSVLEEAKRSWGPNDKHILSFSFPNAA